MSSGVIVCGTQVGLLYDEPDCCISVPLKDFERLANRVLQLLKDEHGMSSMRQNAYTWARDHSIHWTTAMVSNEYKRLMGSHI